MLTLSVAMDQNRVIGYQGHLPWHLPADLDHFRIITKGKPILMGYYTYHSIGHPLSGRLNVVLTRKKVSIPGCHQVLHSLDEVLNFHPFYEEVVVIGGEQVFELLMPYVQRMYITHVHTTVKGDTYFPDYPADKWQEISRQDYPADSRNVFPYSFSTLQYKYDDFWVK